MPRAPKLSAAQQQQGVHRAFRKERGITHVEVAVRLGSRRTLVTGYETGSLRLTAEMAVRLDLALDARRVDSSSWQAASRKVMLSGRPKEPAGKPPCRTPFVRFLQIAGLETIRLA